MRSVSYMYTILLFHDIERLYECASMLHLHVHCRSCFKWSHTSLYSHGSDWRQAAQRQPPFHFTASPMSRRCHSTHYSLYWIWRSPYLMVLGTVSFDSQVHVNI